MHSVDGGGASKWGREYREGLARRQMKFQFCTHSVDGDGASEDANIARGSLGNK